MHGIIVTFYLPDILSEYSMLFNQLHVPPFNNQWIEKVEFWLVYKQLHKIKITGKHALYIGQSYIWSRKIYTGISLLNIFLYIYIFLFFLLIRAYSFTLEYSDKNVIYQSKKKVRYGTLGGTVEPVI